MDRTKSKISDPLIRCTSFSYFTSMDSRDDPATDGHSGKEGKKQAPTAGTRRTSARQANAAKQRKNSEDAEDLKKQFLDLQAKHASMARELADARNKGQRAVSLANQKTAEAQQLEEELARAKKSAVISKKKETTKGEEKQKEIPKREMAALQEEIRVMKQSTLDKEAEAVRSREKLIKEVAMAEAKAADMAAKLEAHEKKLSAIPVASTMPAGNAAVTSSLAPATGPVGTAIGASQPRTYVPPVGKEADAMRLMVALESVGLDEMIFGQHYKQAAALDASIVTTVLRDRLPSMVHALPELLGNRPADPPALFAAKCFLAGALQEFVSFDMSAAGPASTTPVAHTEVHHGETKSSKGGGLSGGDVTELMEIIDSISVEHGMRPKGKALFLRVVGRVRAANGKLSNATKDESDEQLRFLFEKMFEVIERDARRGSPIFEANTFMRSQFNEGKFAGQPVACRIVGRKILDV